MRINGRLVYGWLLAVLLLLTPVARVAADEVILDPGRLQGEVTLGVFNIASLYVSANNAQYSSTVQPADNAYSMTLYGDQTYNVSTQAFLRDTNAYAPYTYVYFKSRSIAVPKGTTVVNDYTVNPGSIRFRLSIIGASYSSWYVYGYAAAYPAGAEQTYSRTYAESGTSPSGEWVMPVVPNQQIQIYAYVYVDGKLYDFYLDPAYYQDIDPGEEVVVPLVVDHVAPRGTVQGSIALNNIGDAFTLHNLYTDPGSQYVYGYENPYGYTINEVLSGSTLRAYTYMDDQRTYLEWPYPQGDQDNAVVTLAEGETVTRNYIADAGALLGRIRLSGTLTNATAGTLRLSLNGIYDTETYGGYVYTSNFDAQGYYRLFLPPGPWENSYLSAYESVAGYSRSLNIYDYSWPQVAVTAGGETLVNRDYCTGSLTVGFRVAGGGVITNPYIQAGMSQTNADGTRLYTNAYSTHYTSGENPEVEINGLAGPHQFNCFGTLADGSRPKFGTLNVTLECGVKKGRELGSPTIVIDSPGGPPVVSDNRFEVSGTATDDSGIAAITVNDNPVPFASSNNPDDPNEVAFTTEVDLNAGANTIRTEVTDNSGLVSFDERVVMVDDWTPEVAWDAPQGTYLEGAAVPWQVVGSDQGYGATLKVYLDGVSISEKEMEGDDSDPEAVTLADTLTGLAVGTHTLTAVLTDAAGNAATAERIFQVAVYHQVSGNGYVYPETSAYRANVNLFIAESDLSAGFLRYYYTKGRVSFVGTTVTSLTVTDRTATISGTGRLNGVDGYAFTATVEDGAPDRFGLIVKQNANVVSHNIGPSDLSGGNLIITP